MLLMSFLHFLELEYLGTKPENPGEGDWGWIVYFSGVELCTLLGIDNQGLNFDYFGVTFLKTLFHPRCSPRKLFSAFRLISVSYCL